MTVNEPKVVISPLARTRMNDALPPKFDKFSDLIYCPLDLPEPPIIDLDELLEWSKNISPDHPNQSQSILLPDGKTIQTPEAATRRTLGYYPWLSIWMKRSNQFVPQNNGWMQEFIDKYPDLYNYVLQFPLKETSAVNLMWQYEDTPVMIHTDPEHWFGMRLYLNNTPDAPLFFLKAKERNNHRIEYIATDINDPKLAEHVDINKHYVKYYKPSFPWILNNFRALHGVDKSNNPLGKRAVIVIHGKFQNNESPLDFDKLYDLLERSVEKYKDYCIWY